MANWASAPDDTKYGYDDCLKCSTRFKKVTPFQKYCTDNCAKRASADRYRERYGPRKSSKPKTKNAIYDLRKRLKGKYGLTIEGFNDLSKSQGDVCAICGGGPIKGHDRLSVDHVKDSKPPIVRGLLCTYCNLGIGYFDHNPALAMAAAAYLRKAEVQSPA